MKKLLLYIIVAVILTGCSSSSDETIVPEKPAGKEIKNQTDGNTDMEA
jgi:uncharacterized protein YceK